MNQTREPRIVGSTDEIARAIRFAHGPDDFPGKVIFLIGAGCSVTAGIPGAAAIARRMAREVSRRFACCAEDADDVQIYTSLIGKKLLTPCLTGDPAMAPTDATIDWYRVYDAMFRELYTTPDDVRELFASLVAEARGAINWAHLCLGELVYRGYISTVLTTNFDQLVLAGLVRAGVLPVVCDGIESLNRIAGVPRHPQLVELHGSRHTYLLRNRPEDVEALRSDSQASAAIQKLFQHATTFIVVGYGGREDGIMDLLVQAGRVYPDKNLFWVTRSPDPKTIGPKVRDFLHTSHNAGLLPNQDADRFFLELSRALEVGSPGAISRPLDTLERVIAAITESRVENDDIRQEIASARDHLARLRRIDAETPPDDPVAEIVANIREARLAGNAAEAYRLAKEAMPS